MLCAYLCSIRNNKSSIIRKLNYYDSRINRFSSSISVFVNTKVVYNVSSDDKKVTNIEAYSVSEGKYLKRLYKINFIYNAEGEVTNKNTYQWDERNSGYILKDTEKFSK